MSKLMTSKFQL